MPEDQVGQDSPPVIEKILERYPRRKDARKTSSPQTKSAENSKQELLEKTVAKLAAQKLASMEVEISDLVRSNQINRSYVDTFYVNRHKTGGFDISGQFDEIIGSDGKPADIGFHLINEGVLKEVSGNLGVDAQFVLRIGTNTEEQITKTPEQLKEPDSQFGVKVTTCYLFDARGNFGKALELYKTVNDPRESLNTNPVNKNEVRSYRYVKSVMTPPDFELAGTALSLILKRAQSQTPQTPDP